MSATFAEREHRRAQGLAPAEDKLVGRVRSDLKLTGAMPQSDGSRRYKTKHGTEAVMNVGSELDDLEDRLRHVVADMRTTLDEPGELRRDVAAKGKR